MIHGTAQLPNLGLSDAWVVLGYDAQIRHGYDDNMHAVDMAGTHILHIKYRAS